ncbi:protein LTO1 homolog [Episyrphus balteatus]|uniref:protein LTO1 homolog n=1 Tax=Episyrphus balteatus TaxID=286459 RepID=UPI002485E9C2|nr:protein LTO1 homolog [Episyrphus balteatus]
MTTLEERDINDIFDDIALIEEKLSKKSYQEGFEDGVKEGNLEGYKIGYAQGVSLGEELGSYYGTVIAHLQLPHSERIRKTLELVKSAIEKFPRANDPEADIVGEIQQIRTQYKKLKAMLRLPTEETSVEQKDLSF